MLQFQGNVPSLFQTTAWDLGTLVNLRSSFVPETYPTICLPLTSKKLKYFWLQMVSDSVGEVLSDQDSDVDPWKYLP